MEDNRLLITFKKRKVFGKWYLDPLCERAKTLVALMGRSNEKRRVMAMDRLDEVEKLGFNVEIQE